MNNLFRKKSAEKVMRDAAQELSDNPHAGLHKNLNVRDLTAFGIAAIVGAGIFSTIGKASYDGGPGIILLFLFVAMACTFSAFCYAEFASIIPVSGSAYTYSYVAFGELIAWIIGWDLLMEYAIGNIAVAISWSDYFTTLLAGMHINIPAYFTMDYWTAKAGESEAALAAWTHAPQLAGIRIICDLPAFLITVIITTITYIGIKETKRSANLMVLLKLIVILVVIMVGAFYVKPENWSPFLPNKIAGVLKGVSAVFFAYIGFDAISTTAEECKDPQRDMPRSMIYSLVICTIIYIALALVLTGMVPYYKLDVGDPLAFVFNELHMDWLAGIVAVSAVVATASVLLVFQLGQPRIWMSMSRDGLLPKIFSRIHPKFKTPSFSTILTGFVVGIPALFLNMNVVIDLTSVGTLFAFVLVCAGILKLQQDKNRIQPRFKTPYINARWIMPILFLISIGLIYQFNRDNAGDFFLNRVLVDAEVLEGRLSSEEKTTCMQYLDQHQMAYEKDGKDQLVLLSSLSSSDYRDMLRGTSIPDSLKYQHGWLAFRFHFLMWVFLLLSVSLVILSVWRSYSLIPVLGLLSCTYLLSESGTTNWERFIIWLLVGVVVYFAYGYRKSKLATEKAS